MTSGKTCPSCGAEISADAMDGFCLKCLGKLAFAGAPSGGEIPETHRIADYELLEEIARGGMGVVYRARQLSLNRIVAVKVVLSSPFSNPEFVRRFRTEAEAAAALRHPNIVAIHEVGAQDGRHFLSMEYIEGRSFAGLVREHPLPALRAAGYLHSIALAVQHAHEHGVLHRDLKPSNILLDVFDQPRITDFGLAKLQHRDAELTVPGQVLGSPNYIPPEQAAGDFTRIGPHSDVYSLGTILYHLLTGRPPFQGETLHEILNQVQAADPVPPRKLNPSVPPDLQTICLKCLQKEPVCRYATALELAQDLESFLAGKPIRARPVSFAESAWLWCRRRPALATLGLALCVAVGAGLAGILYEWHRSNLHAQGEMQQRLVAEKNAAITRLNLYAADVAFASEVMQQGDFGHARRTLERLIPAAGETDLRGFEWYYLWNLCRGEQTATLSGHKWIVTCVACSPDGKLIASGGMGGQVKIWDAASQTCLKTLEVSTGAVWSLAFTPENHTLMVADTDGVQLFDRDSWSTMATFPGRLASLSRDGTLLAASESSPFYWDVTGPISLWNTVTKQRLRTFEGTGRAAVLSPDGKFLAVAAVTNGVRLYDAVSGQLLRSLPTARPVWSLTFSPDNDALLAAGWSGDVSLWRPLASGPGRIFFANNLNVWSAIFSPDGKQIVTTSSDQTVRYWDATSLEPLKVLHGHENEVWCAAFRPDGRLVTGGKDQKVLLWPADVPVHQPEMAGYNGAVPLFSPDNTRLLTVRPTEDISSALWSVTNGTMLAKDLAWRHLIAGFSADGKAIIAISADRHGLEFWSPAATEPTRTVPLQNLPAYVKEFSRWGLSPERDVFFAIDAAGVIRVWDVTTGQCTGSFAGPAQPVHNAVLGPHGKQLAVSTVLLYAASLYDCASGKMLSLAGHHDFVSGLAFSPDGTTLATGSMDGTIRLWHTTDGQPAGLLPGHLEETSDIAFSPDGRTLASVGQRESLKLWQLSTMREVFSADLPHIGRHLMFSPDGQHLAVNTDEGKVIVFDAPR